jgi:O-methyltransferase
MQRIPSMGGGGDGDMFFRTRELEVQRDELLVLVGELTAQRDSFMQTINEISRQREELTGHVEQIGRQRDDMIQNVEEIGKQRDSFIANVKQIGRQRDDMIKQVEEIAFQRDNYIAAIAEMDKQRDQAFKYYETATKDVAAIAAQRDSLVQQLAGATRTASKKSGASGMGISDSNTQTSYLDLMEQVLTGTIYSDPAIPTHDKKGFNANDRLRGLDWPANAYSMIGVARMRNFRTLLEDAVVKRTPGDIVETGVWRGGASMMAKAVLNAFGDMKRRIFLADSFEGLPPPDERTYPADKGSTFHEYEQLAVSEEQVRENFRKLGLLDDRVIMIKGWFRDTMPNFPAEKIAVLRLDGDMYESTIDPLKALYDKVSKKGWVIVDDYEWIPACKQAVHDFLDSRKLKPDIKHIDGVGVFFQKA